MPKFTTNQRKTIRDLVFQAVCQQKTLEGISDYVKDKSGLSICIDEADRLKKKLRKEAREWLFILASSNHEYIAEYRERIEAVKYQIKRANELFDKPAPVKQIIRESHNPDGTITKTTEIQKLDDRDFKRRVTTDISNMEKTLMEMYDAMPIVRELATRQGKEVIQQPQKNNGIPK